MTFFTVNNGDVLCAACAEEERREKVYREGAYDGLLRDDEADPTIPQYCAACGDKNDTAIAAEEAMEHDEEQPDEYGDIEDE